MVNSNFYKDKSILITGHTGFKGSWLSLWLQQMGAKVIGFALPPSTSPSLFELAHVEKGMISITGDVRDLSAFKKVVQEYQPEIIIHMAAQALVLSSYDDPVETYSTNVLGVVNLFEAVRSVNSVRAVINVTTDKCYENKEWVWPYRETDPMGGFDPYSSSKGCAELVTAAYRSSFFNPLKFDEHKVAVASARAGNVIGGGDWAKNRLIPDIFRNISEGNTVIIRNPTAIRPWQHVLEPLSGYLLLAEKLFTNGTKYAEAWNFGPRYEDVKNVQWIFDSIKRKWDKKIKWEIEKSDAAKHEAHYLKLDISKAISLLNWEPQLSMDKTIDKIVSWYTAYMSGENMRDITLEQIKNYEKIIER